MSICGIIAEYNPLHQGHIYQLNKAKENFDTVVVITSMYYSQRGLPSLLLPEDKARLALHYGADLVIGLPACYAAQSAQYFSKYAMESLHQVPIEYLLFGSECNDITLLESLYESSQKQEIDASTSINHNQNLDLLPNDQLAMYYVHYCKQYGIQPISMKRNNAFKSATQTRADYFGGKNELFSESFQANQRWESYYPYLRTFLLLSPKSVLESFFLVNEGIESRLKKAAKEDTWDKFLMVAISKTYSKVRIQRTCLMILLQIKKEDMATHNQYERIQVLGFNENGQNLLRHCSSVSTKFKEMDSFDQWIETQTLNLYNSVQDKPILRKAVIRQ